MKNLSIGPIPRFPMKGVFSHQVLKFGTFGFVVNNIVPPSYSPPTQALKRKNSPSAHPRPRLQQAGILIRKMLLAPPVKGRVLQDPTYRSRGQIFFFR